MARKRKGELPSGNIRRQIYNGMKQKIDKKTGLPVFDADGKPVMIRDYISVTGSDVKEVEKKKSKAIIEQKGTGKTGDITLREAIDAHIAKKENLLSPTTIAGYETIKKYGFVGIMDMPLNKLNQDKLEQAVAIESQRPSCSTRSKGKPISTKTLHNEWGLISEVIQIYHPSLSYKIKLPEFVSAVHTLSRPEDIYRIVKGTEIELAVLLAMWLTFTMSEIRGLTKSKSIKGDCIYISEVMVTVNGKDVVKKIAKNKKRNRIHRMPQRIRELVEASKTDLLVPLSEDTIYGRFTRLLRANNMPHMSFHDLRHVSASVMSLLDIPDQYAMDRGGWTSDKIMKSTYMQIYKSERIAVDNIIDSYFESALELSDSISNNPKYRAWLTLFDKTDSPETQKEYEKFVQVQHECNTEK